MRLGDYTPGAPGRRRRAMWDQRPLQPSAYRLNSSCTPTPLLGPLLELKQNLHPTPGRTRSEVRIPRGRAPSDLSAPGLCPRDVYSAPPLPPTSPALVAAATGAHCADAGPLSTSMGSGVSAAPAPLALAAGSSVLAASIGTSEPARSKCLLTSRRCPQAPLLHGRPHAHHGPRKSK